MLLSIPVLFVSVMFIVEVSFITVVFSFDELRCDARKSIFPEPVSSLLVPLVVVVVVVSEPVSSSSVVPLVVVVRSGLLLVLQSGPSQPCVCAYIREGMYVCVCCRTTLIWIVVHVYIRSRTT